MEKNDYKIGWNAFVTGSFYGHYESQEWKNGWLSAKLYQTMIGRTPDPM